MHLFIITMHNANVFIPSLLITLSLVPYHILCHDHNHPYFLTLTMSIHLFPGRHPYCYIHLTSSNLLGTLFSILHFIGFCTKSHFARFLCLTLSLPQHHRLINCSLLLLWLLILSDIYSRYLNWQTTFSTSPLCFSH